MNKMFLSIALLGLAFMSSDRVTQAAGTPDMIFWEFQRWDGSGDSERITLWADGTSEVRLKRYGVVNTLPGWSAEKKGKRTISWKENVFSDVETQRLFERALAAGIQELRTFPITHNEGQGWLVGVRVDGKIVEKRTPMFTNPDAKDDWGSENHKRFQSVRSILESALTNAQKTM